MASRRQYGPNLQRLLLNGCELVLWDLDRKKVYFSAPKSIRRLELSVRDFLRDPSKRQDARHEAGQLQIDGKVMRRSDDRYSLFSVDESNFYVSPEKTLKVDFKAASYEVDVREIALSLANQFIYGGSFRVSKVPDGLAKPNFLNHGALVSMFGEPALERFANLLTAGMQTSEEKAQSLLGFVTDEIEYDEKEFYFGREFLQRSSETLLGRLGDCSNKAILYASLLEQIEQKYAFAYSNNHIFVVLPKGNFVDSTAYGFTFDDRNWVIAETTVKGFRIGRTLLKQEDLIKNIKYTQIPRERNVLYTYPGKRMIMFS